MAVDERFDVRRELEELARRLVDHPDELHVEETEDGDTVRFELSAAPEDLGQVIGRQGRTARALRTLLDARATLTGDRYELEILDD